MLHLTTHHPAYILRGNSDRDLRQKFERGSRYLNNTLVKLPIGELSPIYQKAVDQGFIGLDFEWNPDTGKVHSVGLANEDSCIGVVITDEVLSLIRLIFKNSDMEVVGHNILADVIKAMDMIGTDINCKFMDTLILQRDLGGKDYIKDMSLEYYGDYELFMENFKHRNDLDFFKEPSPELLYRTAGDAWSGILLAKHFQERYGEHIESMEAAIELDMALIPAVANMMRTGIKIDFDELSKTRDELTAAILEIRTDLKTRFDLANPNATKKVLDKLVEIGYNIKDTRKETLITLDGDLPETILEYRKLKKSLEFFNSIPEKVDSDNVIRTNLRISGANTGRFTCSNPNMQQQPKIVRPVFCSIFGDDGILYEVDASQSELRCLGYCAQSKNIKQAYDNDIDFHRLTASTMYRVDPDEVTDAQRQNAKTLNFASIYGAGDYLLTNELMKATKLSKKRAERIVKNYRATMSKLGVAGYQKKLLRSAKSKGYVESPTGRRGYRLDPTDVVNYPVQSFSSDLNKERMLALYNAFREEKLVSRVWLELHDAAHLDVYKPEIPIVEEIIESLDTTIPDVLDYGMEMKLPIEAKEHGSHWS